MKIADAIRTAIFMTKLFFCQNLRNPFRHVRKNRDRPINVLVNGPSLKSFLLSLPDDGSADYCVVNDFVHDSSYSVIKPTLYALSDPKYFIDTIKMEQGKSAMKAIAAKTEWEMTLLIPWRYKDSEYLDGIRKNGNITLLVYHDILYTGLDTLRNRIFSKGLGNGEYGTVAINAIYGAIMAGYRDINLYGFDHTFFDNIAVDSQNRLCHKESHFYGEDSQLKPMVCHYKGIDQPAKNFRMSEFLYEKYLVFKGHEVMDSFAKYMKVTIYNHTDTSLIDSYTRISIN